MASPSARVRLICCFHLCAILLWIFMVHSDQMILPKGEHLDSWDCFTHGILSCWKSTATAALSVVWRAYVLFLPTVASDYWWALVFFCLVCLGTAWHSLLSYILSTCWLCGVVLLQSWPFAWLSGVASWPADCLTVTTYCPVHLLTGMFRLLIVLSIWLYMGIGLWLPCLLLQVPGIAFLLSASADFVELLFCCLAHLLTVWYCFSNLLNAWHFPHAFSLDPWI